MLHRKDFSKSSEDTAYPTASTKQTKTPGPALCVLTQLLTKKKLSCRSPHKLHSRS